MNVPPGILKRSGNYFIVRGLSQYARVKRYAFLVVFQGPDMTAPMLLKGFGKSERDLADRYLDSKAQRGLEQKRYEVRAAEDLERKKAGMVCIPASDVSKRREFLDKGYHSVLVEGENEWFAKMCTRSTHEAFAVVHLDGQRPGAVKRCPECGNSIRLIFSRASRGVSVLTVDLGSFRRAA